MNTIPAPPRSPASRLPRRLRALAGRPYVRLAVLSAAAAAVAYGIGSMSPHVSAVVAGITALISVRPTFHASVQEALRQVLGVVVGGVFAYVMVELLGFSIVAIFLAMLVCFAAARVLRIGEEGAAAVGVTVILVLGPTFNPDAVETRLLGVVVGSLVALVSSFFTRPGTPHGRALSEVVAQEQRCAGLLTSIAASLRTSRGYVGELAARSWLAEAEDVLARTVEIRAAAEDAVEGARWSPMIGREEAAAVLQQVRIAERTAMTAVGMCRDLLAAADDTGPMPAGLAAALSEVLLATAGAITVQSEGARVHPAETLDSGTGPVGAVARSRREAVAEVREVEDTRPLLLGGSLLRDSQKITDILSGR